MLNNNNNNNNNALNVQQTDKSSGQFKKFNELTAMNLSMGEKNKSEKKTNHAFSNNTVLTWISRVENGTKFLRQTKCVEFNVQR